MTLEILLIWLVVGAVAGWIGSVIVDGGGSGLIADIIIGITGALSSADGCLGTLASTCSRASWARYSPRQSGPSCCCCWCGR